MIPVQQQNKKQQQRTNRWRLTYAFRRKQVWKLKHISPHINLKQFIQFCHFNCDLTLKSLQSRQWNLISPKIKRNTQVRTIKTISSIDTNFQLTSLTDFKNLQTNLVHNRRNWPHFPVKKHTPNNWSCEIWGRQ